MENVDDVVEIPIEAAQEYITSALGFAPLQLSDDSNCLNITQWSL